MEIVYSDVDPVLWGAAELSVRAQLDSSWAVLADRVMAPRLDSADVELVRAQMLGAAQQRIASPDAHVSHVADSVAFGSTR